MALPSLHDMLISLIGTPSVSCTLDALDTSNLPVINQLASWCESLGFKTDIRCVDEKRKKYNLLASLGAGPGGIILAGHTDTVPYDLDRWQTDPFKLTEKDGKYFGLGSTDMKGFFAVALEAVRRMQGQPLKAPVFILATADEETTMSGAKALATLGLPKARAAIVGEPTGLRPVRMHKGITMQSIRIQGLAGHSSNPALGVNAMDVMYKVMGELNSLRSELQQKYHHAGFSVPRPTLNFGCIHGGDNPNRICGACELQFDVRTLPGMSLDEIKQTIREKVALITAQENATFSMTDLFDGVDAFETDANSELVKLAEKLSGYGAQAVGFATEAPYLARQKIDTIVMGPGEIDQAHQPNEYMRIDQIEPMIKYLSSMLQHYCL